MHEGLTVDPATGFDEGPRLSRWLPSVKMITTAFLAVWLVFAFTPLKRTGWVLPLMPLLFLTMCGAATLILGLEARALSRCLGADTSASRQLRWERGLMFGVVGLLAALPVCAFATGTLDRFATPTAVRIVMGTVGGLNLVALLVGLALVRRHRPDRIGPAEHPKAPERR
jgi:4-amino-4-deoxy-L-arabinose transferase-like glycosyltransferase